ncbi:MAG TPA: Uma2 family endonuclease [Stellaceae bacterium]|nr:Uma2 family endonuclease [Stellaceae bacterium]
MSALPQIIPPPTMTVDEFLDWSGDGSAAKHQLVDGEIRAMAPASIRHGRIQANIARLIGNHLGDGPCQIVVEPGIVPRVRSDANLRVPDLGVTCESDELAQQTLLNPILLIEILSPSNQSETRANIWSYASIPTLREILLVHSTRLAAEVLQRQNDDSWPADAQVLGPGDTISLVSIDFRCSLPDFYRGTRLTAPRAS